jgi:hypothetical protein
MPVKKKLYKPTGSNKVVLNSTSVDSPGYFNVNASCSFTQTGGQTITGHGFLLCDDSNPDINASVKNLGKHTGSVISQQKFPILKTIKSIISVRMPHLQE